MTDQPPDSPPWGTTPWDKLYIAVDEGKPLSHRNARILKERILELRDLRDKARGAKRDALREAMNVFLYPIEPDDV